MKNFNKLIILLLSLIFIFLNGCKNLRENLSLKKKAGTDEFLVQKKNPLVLPPDYRDLPKPMAKSKITNQKEKEIDFSKIFNNSKKTDSENSFDINQSLEDSIRKKIETN